MNDNLLIEALKIHSVNLSDEMLRQFSHYLNHLLTVNEHMNLTAIRDPDEAVIRHFVDSLMPLALLDMKEGAAVIDIGTGAGFPGLPLKIARPDLALTLLDSLNKRVGFLKETVSLLGLDGVQCLHGRAEELSRVPSMRESFDFAFSRAVAALPVLLELCLPFVKVGGRFIAMKGPTPEEETAAAAGALKKLGGRPPKQLCYMLPTGQTHTLLVIEKEKATPPAYPRPYGKMQKAPL